MFIFKNTKVSKIFEKTLILTLIICVVCFIGIEQEAKANETVLRLATATTAGVFYADGAAIEQLSKSKMPNITIFSQATGGSGDNVNLLKNKEVEIAFVHNSTAIDAYLGINAYEGKPIKCYKGVVLLWRSFLHFPVRKDSGVESIADYKGKRVQIGPIGSGIEKFTLQPLSLYNISPDDLKAQRLSVSETMDQMKNKQLDAFCHGSIYPDAHISDLMSTGNIKLIGMTEDEIKRMTEKYPMNIPAVIPAGTYANQEKDIHTVASAALIVAREDMDEEIIYQLTKSILENHEELVSMHSSFKDTNLDLATLGFGPIPLHPGAIRYYKEVGILK